MKILAAAETPALPGAVAVIVTGGLVSRFNAAPFEATFTLNVQEAPPTSAAPARVMTPLPALAVIVPPKQEPVKLFGVATTKPVGSVSTNPSPGETDVFGLLRVNVRAVVAPTAMLSAP